MLVIHTVARAGAAVAPPCGASTRGMGTAIAATGKSASRDAVPLRDLLDAVRYEKDAMAYRKTVDAMYSTLKRVSTMRVALKPIPRRRPPIKD